MDSITGEKRKRGPEDDLSSGAPQAPSTSRDLDYNVLEVDACTTSSLSSYHVHSLHDFNERGFFYENPLSVPEYSFDIPDIAQINYLIKARREKMLLIEGDSETFKSILALMDDYEGLL